VLTLGSEPYLDVARLCRTRPGFLGALDRLSYELGEEVRKASEVDIGDAEVVGDIHDWHGLILPASGRRTALSRRSVALEGLLGLACD
jgi:hypothetical protein